MDKENPVLLENKEKCILEQTNATVNDSKTTNNPPENFTLKQFGRRSDEEKSSDDDVDWKQVAKTLRERLEFAYFKTRRGWQKYDLKTCERLCEEQLQSRNNIQQFALSPSFNFSANLVNYTEQVAETSNSPKYKFLKKHKKRTHKDLSDLHPSKKLKRHMTSSIRQGEASPIRTSTNQFNLMPASPATMLNQFATTVEQNGTSGILAPLSDHWTVDPIFNEGLMSNVVEAGASPPSTPPQQPKTPTDEHAAELLYFFASSPVASSPARTPVSRFLDTHHGYTTPPHRSTVDTSNSTPKSAFSLSEYINVTPTPKSSHSLGEYNNVSPSPSKLIIKNFNQPTKPLPKAPTTLLGDRQKASSITAAHTPPPPALSLSFDEYVSGDTLTPTKPPSKSPLLSEFRSMNPTPTKSTTTN